MKKLTTFLLGFLVCLNISFACINDMSSIRFEQQKFPEEEDLISGKFHIHSKDFYQWRIKDRLKKLEIDSNNPALLDDLAVSYEKTGQTQLAIDTLQSVLHKYPNRYETLANLGTFYIHHQEYQKGLALLKKAIKINPAAHYGREIYQIKVVEYIISLNKKPPFVFPIQKDKDFSDFLLKSVEKEKQKDELIRAIVGVSGMLKFGNTDSPILLEVLGDLYNRVYKDYTWPQGSTNQIKEYATKFYIAAYLKSDKNYIPENLHALSIVNMDGEYLKNTILINFFELKNFNNDSYKLFSVNSDIKEANKYKEELYKQERQMIGVNKDTENTIYQQLFPEAKIQVDLFEDKKETINKELQYTINMVIKEIIDGFMILVLLLNVFFICITLVFSLIMVNYLHSTSKDIIVSNYNNKLLRYGSMLLNFSIPLVIISSMASMYWPLILPIIYLFHIAFMIMFIKANLCVEYEDNFNKTYKVMRIYYKIYLWIFFISLICTVLYFGLPYLFDIESHGSAIKTL